jgi:hypothetical protein
MNGMRFSSMTMPTDRQGGAARMTVFLALWSLALVVLHDVRVDAAPVYETSTSNWSAAPAPLPRVDSPTLWNAFAEHSDVMSGRWSPDRKSAMHRKSARSSVAQSRSAPPSNVSVVHSNGREPSVASPSARRDVVVAPADESVHSTTPTKPTEVVSESKAPSAIAETERAVAEQLARREFDAALASIERARAQSPDGDSRLRLLDARVAIARGDFERAYAQLLERLPDVRATTEQHDLLAAAMLRTGRFSESASVYRALLSVDARNARWWAGYAMAENGLGHRSESLTAYRALQSLVPPGTPLSSWATLQIERMT